MPASTCWHQWYTMHFWLTSNIDTLYQIQRSTILIILIRYGDGLVIGFVYLRCWDVTNTCAHTLYIDCVLTTPLCLATTVVLLTSNAASQIFQRATIGSERIHNSHVKHKEQLLCCISSRHYFWLILLQTVVDFFTRHFVYNLFSFLNISSTSGFLKFLLIFVSNAQREEPLKLLIAWQHLV